ncbi:hypothetical protein EHI8A_003090 [Entamoeba histolytica HM-1:IMSS-B]|uniref:Uncharacterized protein n=8 Tax=Entamoeba TaxID=5758 RepID=C4LWF8_ENTH1|nr:hypothetical protein ENU1_085590 [Entamoeba nuttalli P19]XP_656921.1 hypothetical protein EHI_096450 [Entamoeba histolytica HM-1:IMSS]EMD47641.1 Hypothetical protein EHI5A_005220 [Entamoeba histolytica KU27]EMH77787.1 hypothetical protein EHI8A_003090 [Entamoeba histolytica HM-1:IMSS-B]EMS11782.1 hypothetical protein KM1_004020 [Entamoeba histolytica HM-3:IMSS]ENY64808.1 hypothetical protein EHI7A_001480 [Entamoeba histolytica HM-1:IMSS-A]BAN39285.1 hypothetical protein [Entamoeba histolyt|eukprot:XP_008857056.1 hypothetical protein ENU1_085590 [Entamoeba nuttalli P19]
MSESETSQQLSESTEANEAPVIETAQFNEIVPLKGDVMEHFEKIPRKINGCDYAFCKYCKAESDKGGDNKLFRIRAKPENLRRHLKCCKYFCAAKGIALKPKINNIPGGGKRPRIDPKTEKENVVVVAPLAICSAGCKTLTVKYSRKSESMDITPGMTAQEVVDSLKEIFDIDPSAKCYLRRETEHKVLIGCCDLMLLINNGETLRLECSK